MSKIMDTNILMLTSFGVPILGSFILPGLGRLNKETRNITALLFIVYPLVAVSLMGPSVFAGLKPEFNMGFALGLSVLFRADMLGWFMAVVSLFISALILIYSWNYIDHYENQNEYYCMGDPVFGLHDRPHFFFKPDTSIHVLGAYRICELQTDRFLQER